MEPTEEKVLFSGIHNLVIFKSIYTLIKGGKFNLTIINNKNNDFFLRTHSSIERYPYGSGFAWQSDNKFLAELRRPKTRKAEPHSHIRELKGTPELIFSCVPWLAVLLVGAYARRRRRRRRRRWWSRATWRPYSNIRLTETCSLALGCY